MAMSMLNLILMVLLGYIISLMVKMRLFIGMKSKINILLDSLQMVILLLVIIVLLIFIMFLFLVKFSIDLTFSILLLLLYFLLLVVCGCLICLLQLSEKGVF